MKKHPLNYLPRWVSVNPLGNVLYIKRHDGWSLREIVGMWLAARHDPRINDGTQFAPADANEAFFMATAERRYDEATDWYCVNGCCVVTWGSGKRGNMGGYGPAGCSCDDLDEPRDLARGPIPKASKSL